MKKPNEAGILLIKNVTKSQEDLEKLREHLEGEIQKLILDAFSQTDIQQDCEEYFSDHVFKITDCHIKYLIDGRWDIVIRLLEVIYKDIIVQLKHKNPDKIGIIKLEVEVRNDRFITDLTVVYYYKFLPITL